MRIDVLLNPECKEITFALFNVARNLSTMGCSWFLNCLYNEKVDRSYQNFTLVGKTFSGRSHAFEQSREFHKILFFFIKDCMSLDDLAKNKLGLSRNDLKTMINALSHFYG